jgi:hypothetical protein
LRLHGQNVEDVLTIISSSAEPLAVRLNALKPRFAQQVQLNALTGFRFVEAGEYRFIISPDSSSIERSLHVAAGSPYEIDLDARDQDE